MRKLEPNRWESVGDLARWLLTHEDEFEFAVICANRTDGTMDTFACPKAPVIKVLGLIELAKSCFLEASMSHDDEKPSEKSS